MTQLINVTEKAYDLSKDSTLPPEVGEIVEEQNKIFAKMMGEIIATHRKYAPVYFISVWSQKDPFMVNVLKRKYIVRKSCPDPDWNSEVYSYDNRSDKLTLEWVLPTEQDAATILKNKEMYDPSLISFIQKHQARTLKIPTYSP
mgnify:CR=1 FL=1